MAWKCSRFDYLFVLANELTHKLALAGKATRMVLILRAAFRLGHERAPRVKNLS
jgi:hypothetical protein